MNLISAGTDTLLEYDADAQVGGRIASVGQRLIDSSAKAIILESLEGLNANVKARHDAGAGEGAEVITVNQADFATRVAKEVAGDLASPAVRTALLVAGVVVAGAAIFLLVP